MAEDIARLCEVAGWEPDALLGHSAGAAVGLRLSELMPRPPACVVGINAALGTFEGVSGWVFPIAAKILALTPLAAQIFARLSGGEVRVRQLLDSTGSRLDDEGVGLYRTLVHDPAHVDATLAMMAQWSLDELLARLPEVRVPVLLIASDADRAVPANISEKAAARLPNGSVAIIPGKGHLVHEEAPDAVSALLLPFLERCLKGQRTA
jgi:magnesium chelatase accessory protein